MGDHLNPVLFRFSRNFWTFSCPQTRHHIKQISNFLQLLQALTLDFIIIFILNQHTVTSKYSPRIVSLLFYKLIYFLGIYYHWTIDHPVACWWLVFVLFASKIKKQAQQSWRLETNSRVSRPLAFYPAKSTASASSPPPLPTQNPAFKYQVNIAPYNSVHFHPHLTPNESLFSGWKSTEWMNELYGNMDCVYRFNILTLGLSSPRIVSSYYNVNSNRIRYASRLMQL